MKSLLKLESLEQLGWRFGLETIQALLSELNHPEMGLKVIHVAGSNGKGSTCAFTASFLKNRGYKTGLYTSPHLSDIRERFRVNGTWISQRDFDRHSRFVLDTCLKVKKRLGYFPTHFEALTAIAFCWFKEQRVDWLVLEVGLGGRLDATNVIERPIVSLITPVGLEHQNILGKTVDKIAAEKAGILKSNGLAATIQYQPAALSSILQIAEKKRARVWVGGKDFKFGPSRLGFYWRGPGFEGELKVPNLPDYQIVNASLALAGIQILRTQGFSADQKLIERSFGEMRWPGRVETISRKPLILMDGAHNPDAARGLVSFLKRQYPRQRWVVLNGFLKDKDYASFARIMKPVTVLSVVTEPESDRTEKGLRIFEAWEKEGVKSIWVNDWKKALTFAQTKTRSGFSNTGLLITGSLYLVGGCRYQLIGFRGLDKI